MLGALGRYEPGLVVIVKAILTAQTAGRFTRLARGRPHEITAAGRRVTLASVGICGLYDAATMMPGVVVAGGGARCWRITVHQAGDYVAIGIIGTGDLGGAHAGYGRNHATAHGWDSDGVVHVAGRAAPGYGGWPVYTCGWQKDDQAAMRLDTAAGTLALKHERHGRSFAIAGLDGGVAEWFVNVGLEDDGDSVEVQPMTTDEYDAFLL